jgi:uncharacterized membrane protein
MLTSIILILLVVLGIYSLRSYTYEVFGMIAVPIFGLYLMVHILCCLIKSYEYELFVEERNAFEQTLNESRKSNNLYESAAIVKQVAEWNQELAKMKYNNKTILFYQYVDDRCELLEPIK